jgi:hypothetical protein
MYKAGEYIMFVTECYELTAHFDGQEYRMKITKTDETDAFEFYEVTGGGKTVTLRNNRPLLIGQQSGKKIHWQVVKGEVTKLDNVLSVGRAIEGLWKRLWNVQNPDVDVKYENKVVG